MKSSYNKKSYPKKSSAVSKARRAARNSKPKKVSIVQVRELIKQSVHRIAENKLYVQDLTPPTLAINGSGLDWNGTTGSNGVLISNLSAPTKTLFPILILGSGQGAREGNKVEPRSFMLRGIIQTLPYESVLITAPVAPFYVHMFVYRKKGNIFDSDTTKILQGGGSAGSSGAFDGTLLKSTYPMNRDLYNVYKHKIFKMAAFPSAISPVGGTGSINSDGWGNGFKMSHIFRCRIPVKKTWKYNDADTNLPTNDNFFCAFAVVNADGTINASNTSRASVACESVLSFEDV